MRKREKEKEGKREREKQKNKNLFYDDGNIFPGTLVTIFFIVIWIWSKRFAICNIGVIFQEIWEQELVQFDVLFFYCKIREAKFFLKCFELGCVREEGRVYGRIVKGGAFQRAVLRSPDSGQLFV